MDSRDAIRPILAGLIGIGLIVLIIVLLVKAFSGGNTAGSNFINITNYTDTPGSSVTLLADAPTGIDQDHRQIKINVSAGGNTIDVIQGYEGKVITTQTYANNTSAYGVFLQTLRVMNFSKGRNVNINYQGYCPTGSRYVFTFNNGTKDAFSYWATSCGSQGTFQGQLGQVLQQFQRQIPSNDFERLTRNIPITF